MARVVSRVAEELTARRGRLDSSRSVSHADAERCPRSPGQNDFKLDAHRPRHCHRARRAREEEEPSATSPTRAYPLAGIQNLSHARTVYVLFSTHRHGTGQPVPGRLAARRCAGRPPSIRPPRAKCLSPADGRLPGLEIMRDHRDIVHFYDTSAQPIFRPCNTKCARRCAKPFRGHMRA